MSIMKESVTVNVPMETAYGAWTRFSTFPQFMEGVREVQEHPGGLTRWTIDVGGVSRQFAAETHINEPQHRVEWASIDGPKHAGKVDFEAINPFTTRVSTEIDIDPEGFMENVADKLGAVNMRVRGDLERFKNHMEAAD